MANMVVEGTSVTAAQLKEFFDQIHAGTITRKTLQNVLERRNPFPSIIDIDPKPDIIENLAKLDRKRGREEWEGWTVVEQHLVRGYPFSERVPRLDLERVKFVEGSLARGTGPEGIVLWNDRINYMYVTGLVLLDANSLINILCNQHLIPESWAKHWGHMVFFCGTILHAPQGGLYVLDITYEKGVWWLNRTALSKDCPNELVVAVY